MAPINLLQDISSQLKTVTKKPDILLEVQNDLASKTTCLLKSLYDFTKKEENNDNTEALSELIIDDFDDEQIWQEIELQNESVCGNKLVSRFAHLLAKGGDLIFKFDRPAVADEIEGDDSNGTLESNQEASDEEGDLDEESDNGSEGDEERIFDDDSSDNSEENNDKLKFTSEVDDDFFKLSEMEQFCDEVEKEEDSKGKSKDSGLDFFSIGGDESDEERELIRYKDFFAKSQKTMKGGKDKGKQKFESFEDDATIDREKDGKKSVRFEELPMLPEDYDSESENEAKLEGPSSAFEMRQDRLKAKIKSLEDEALKEKPWHLQGEAAAKSRPQNSLLEEFVEFDLAARPAPVFTEKTTLRLEDIIKQRVKDKSWDDVSRKVKPVEDIREYRKQLVLDQEKSKISLAEVYEQEYIKQRDAAAARPGEEKQEVEPPEHVQIRKMIKSLFSKLDALSNFHYTPKPVAPEVKIISNLPAITMEDVAPVATSDAALLAPEEVKDKKKGELVGKEERTLGDKKRERRQKKLRQREKQKDKLKKEKTLSKMSLGLGNKYSKEKAKRTLDELTKEKNVDKMVETQSKHLKSSSAFFSKLEDEVKGQIKGAGSNVKRKKFNRDISAKRLKL